MSIDFFDCLKHDLDICIKTLISSRNEAFRCALILSSRERGIPSPYFVLLNIGKRTHLYLNTPSPPFSWRNVEFLFFFGGGEGSSFFILQFRAFRKIFEKSWIQFSPLPSLPPGKPDIHVLQRQSAPCCYCKTFW